MHLPTGVLRLKNFLNEKFPNRWVGRDGPIHWSARSPDLTPLDFFFLGYIKSLVYTPNKVIRDVAHLKEDIQNAITTVDRQMLMSVFNNISKRYEKCIETEGRHIEQYL